MTEAVPTYAPQSRNWSAPPERRQADPRREVVGDWVEAAGGWHDAAAVHLPAALPGNLALATLKAHARALDLVVLDNFC